MRTAAAAPTNGNRRHKMQRRTFHAGTATEQACMQMRATLDTSTDQCMARFAGALPGNRLALSAPCNSKLPKVESRPCFRGGKGSEPCRDPLHRQRSFGIASKPATQQDRQARPMTSMRDLRHSACSGQLLRLTSHRKLSSSLSCRLAT